jgi:hypothetical protein
VNGKRFRYAAAVAFFVSIQCSIAPGAAARNAGAGGASGALLQEALAGPMSGVEEIVFTARLRYNDPHWYANIGYFCDDETSKAWTGLGGPDVGKLYKLNLRTREVNVLLDAQGGGIRDPQVHYDAKRILFSWRKAGTEYYNLYEINVDGTGLRPITSGEFDDLEPTYLPDGGIAFVSTRCKRWVNCWKTQVAILYRCDADGGHIEPISASCEHDNTPWMLPDGRLLYTRWEYVDRSQVEFHHLWAMNPDGAAQTIYYGNMRPGIVMIDAKPIPGSDKILANFSPGHGVNEHAGIATVVTPQCGPDDPRAARPLHRGKHVRDPYPFSEHLFLAARDNQIVLMDDQNRVDVLHTLAGPGLAHEPRPIVPREREKLIPRRADASQSTGRMILSDIYSSRNLAGVRRGEIRKLLVLEVVPKQVNFSGGQDLTSWLGTFSLERVLGTVPVENDGSAYFEVPANRMLFFVALDANDLSVKRMHSFTSSAPGETQGCVGCHEARQKTPEPRGVGTAQALRRPASRIEPFEGFPDVLDFHRDIQPILDRRCVSCHDFAKREGKVLLTGDLGPNWSFAYFSLLAHRQVADGRNGLGNYPPRAIGSSASALLRKVDGSHYGAKATEREWRTLWLWIESGAPYAGTYAALRNVKQQDEAGDAVQRVFRGEHALLKRRCGPCHDVDHPNSETGNPLPLVPEFRRNGRGAQTPTGAYERVVFENDPIAKFGAGILLNFSRPELSPLLLGPLATGAGGFGSCGEVFTSREDADYKTLLAALREAKSIIDADPRYATPQFKPNRQYVREMKKYGILSASFDVANDSIDVFEIDQKYWRSLWHAAAGNGN